MKIMIVTPYFSPKIGGLESYSLTIAKGMIEQGHDVIVVTANHESKVVFNEKIEGVKVTRLPIMIRLSNTPINPFWYFQLKKIINHEKPDVINAHSPVPFMADMAILASGIVPTILTYHAGSMLKGGGLVDIILGFYEKVFLTRLFDRVTKIIAINPAFVEPRVKDKSKVVFIPPGIDTNIFKPHTNRNKANDLLFVGRIETSSQWKGIRVLLSAIAKLKQKGLNVQVRLVGDGDAINMYKEQTKALDITKNVEFAGSLQGTKLVDAYNQSKILVLPSETESESFGMVLIEAMACETPVIGSRVGGIPNVIKDNETGNLFQPKSPSDLAQKISNLLNDDVLRTKYGKAGRQHVINNFSYQQQIKNTENIFDEVVHA